MSDSFKSMIDVWRSFQSKSGGAESFWRFLVRTNPWVFAHHPADECFHEHVWTFRGLHFCKGCVMTVAGWLAGGGLQLGTGWLRSAAIGWLTVSFTALLLPSVITALWAAPRVWKHVARLLLGVLMVSSLWLFAVTDQWWVRGVLITVYFSVKIPLDRRRRRQNNQILHAHATPPKCSGHRGNLRGGRRR